MRDGRNNAPKGTLDIRDDVFQGAAVSKLSIGPSALRNQHHQLRRANSVALTPLFSNSARIASRRSTGTRHPPKHVLL